jgi:hypothetical protein
MVRTNYEWLNRKETLRAAAQADVLWSLFWSFRHPENRVLAQVSFGKHNDQYVLSLLANIETVPLAITLVGDTFEKLGGVAKVLIVDVFDGGEEL